MSYKWKSFLEDEYERLQGMDVSAVMSVVDIVQGKEFFTYKELKDMRECIFNRFQQYRETSGAIREQLETLLRVHIEICKVRPGEGMIKRRHNVLVYKYVIDTIAGNRAIAEKMGISEASLYNDLEMMYKDLILLCAGVPAAFEGIKDRKGFMKWIPKKHLYLSKVEKLDNIERLFPKHLQNKIVLSRELSMRFIQQYNNLLDVYEGYCLKSKNQLDLRRFHCLKEMIFGDGKTIDDRIRSGEYKTMKIYYQDVEKNIERLWELATVASGN